MSRATKNRSSTPLATAQAAHDAAASVRAEKQAVSNERQQRLALAHTTLADLRARASTGDASITAEAVVHAEANISIAESLAEHADRELAEAQESEQYALCELIAETLLSDTHISSRAGNQKQVQDGVTKIAEGIQIVCDAGTEWEAASNKIGQALAIAGVPVGKRVGRVAYVTKGRLSSAARTDVGAKPLLGEFAVHIDSDDIGWLSERQVLDHDHFERSVERVIDDAIDRAKASSLAGVKRQREHDARRMDRIRRDIDREARSRRGQIKAAEDAANDSLPWAERASNVPPLEHFVNIVQAEYEQKMLDEWRHQAAEAEASAD